MNGTNCQLIVGPMHSSSINMFMSRIDNYLVRADSYVWTLDKPKASLSASMHLTCCLDGNVVKILSA